MDYLSLSQDRTNRRKSSSSTYSSLFLERILKKRWTTRDTAAFDYKGALGLNVLYSPSEPLIEYVFVHGLGGGSTKTWCLSEDPSYFWPKEWLPRVPAFRNVRIHSFGYNADWGEKKNSVLNIHDYGQSLLESLRNSPHFGHAEGQNPIVCVGHSMGGLVIKQAYMLARRDPTCEALAKRFNAMVFLATPHRGSNSAHILNNILRASVAHSMRPYISNLECNSEMLTMMNDGFRHYAHDLTLYSYYETEETSTIVGSTLIVPKDSAMLGYSGERVALLNANHRGVCKFKSLSDPNYITIIDAFQTINDTIIKRRKYSDGDHAALTYVLTSWQVSALNAQESWRQMQQIENFLGVSEKPDDDLKDLEEARMPGSCEWFAERVAFQTWIDTDSMASPRIYWVHANPATGKSVLSGYVINTLESLNLDCSYYFFRHGDGGRSSLSGFLRSMTFQMALRSVSIRKRLLSIIERGTRFDRDDPKVVWWKILTPAVFCAELLQPQYWVMDALDECSDLIALFSMITTIESSMPIKIFITSRKTPEIVELFGDLQRQSGSQAAVCEEISFDDTRADITLYLQGNMEKLHVGNDDQRRDFLRRIVDKSQGCFLWVRLVLEELSMAWTVQQVERVLDEVPQGMDPLYTRALNTMSSKPTHAKEIARAILVWTVCPIRPLTIPELQMALKMDVGDDVHDLENAIASLCAQLVYVDKTGRVLMVHLTARTFLVSADLGSEFAINERLCHLRLAQICLQYLALGEMKPPRARRSSRTLMLAPKRSPFVSYVCPSFSEHMRQTTSNNNILPRLLDTFLRTNVLSWIEHIAQTGNLYYLSRTANSVKNYLQRQVSHMPPLGEEIQLAESWVIDLHRLVAKFGSNLVATPSSIYWLIPPFCPASSAISSNFGSRSRGIQVKGLTDTGWDDRLSCIDSQDKQAISVACGESIFAIGLQPGQIVLCHSATCQEWKRLNHGESLRHLRFDSAGTILGSAGRRDLKIWDIETEVILWRFTTAHEILTFTFTANDKMLTAATRANSTCRWSLETGMEIEECPWTGSFDDEGQFRRPPLTATFSPDQSLLAIVYRGRPISLWDLEGQSLHGLIGRESDPSSLALGTNTSPASLVFNSNESVPLLAVAYEDGDLCLFDYEDVRLIKLLEANAQIVACSPDGLTLATGNSAGMVQLMEFETLQLLYRVNAVDYGIRSLAFSGDNLRFLDVRGTQCNVWEPAVLSGLARKDDASTIAAPVEPRIIGISDGEVEITTITLEDSGDYFFIGKSDGTVCVYDTQNGQQKKVLYRHTYQIPVTSTIWGNKRNILVTADAASRFIVCTLAQDRSTGWTLLERLLDTHSEFAILQVLLHPSDDQLLVSTPKSDTVWDISTKTKISTASYTSREPFDWVNHPQNLKERILIGTTGASIWNWESSTITTSADKLQLNSNMTTIKSEGVKNVIQSSGGCRIAVEFSKLYGERSTTQMLIFESTSFRPQAEALIPIQEYQAISQRVLHLIGPYGSKLVFLDRDLWVCSVDIEKSKGGYTYIRHFFIPSDWHSQQRNLNTRITSKGDILFVKVEEIAVIKNGLEFEEVVSISPGS